MEDYRTIHGTATGEYEEKKSRFIAALSFADSEEAAVAFLEQVRAANRTARHNVYAYRLREGSRERYSDDGEPGGTAGVPIYEVLRKEGLTDVCCVVTRYFGGVLLGAGGLVRAYTKGAKDAVDAAQIKCMAEAVKLAVTVDYGLYGRLAQVFADFDARVEDERFADNVRIVLHIRAENSQKLTDKLVDVCNGAVSVEEIEKLNFDFA